MTEPKYFYGIYVASNIWQELGWESIIYIAALSSIDVGLYEAAKIDGAGRFKQVLHVSVPGLLPTIIILLRLWNMRTRLEETKGGMMALASTMARNMFYDKCRRRKFSSDGGIDMEIPFNDLTAEVHDEVRLIKLIVESLPPLQHQVFRMKEIEGYEAEEIMQITGCSADNLRKNLSRARLKIRDTYMKIMKGQR